MEKETPYEKKLRELKDAYDKGVAEAKKEYQEDIESAMKETPTEEWEDKPGVIELIEEALSSHNAELARKIEGLRQQCFRQGEHPCDVDDFNEALDAVLALFDNKNV